MPRIIALKDFISPVHGNVQTGDIFFMQSEGIAESMAKTGFIKIIAETQKPQGEPVPDEMAIDDIKAELNKLGVKYHPRAGKAKLEQLLKDAQDDNASEAAGA